MRESIFQTINFPAFAKRDERYKRLMELDLYLDGEIYNHFAYCFYDEEVAGKYIPIRKRRPSVRFNLYAAYADHIARNLFAGFNAPVIEHKDKRVLDFLNAIKEESKILGKMIELAFWVTVGSSAATFKVVPFGNAGKAKIVMNTRRAKDCTPFFNELDELECLRIHKITSGAELLTRDLTVAFDGKDVDPAGAYWFVRDHKTDVEITYKPIPELQWEPIDSRSNKLIEDESKRHPNNLDFVPAQWFKVRTGKVREYDGRCLWEDAISLVVDFDYTMSTMGAGVRYNATPQVVIKGNLLNVKDDGSFIGGPARYLHLEADKKTDEGMAMVGADASLLEATGNGMNIGIEKFGEMLIKLAKIVIAASQKDPNKVTTAMSAKGMEVLEKEFNNLIQEMRTLCGDEGYLLLLKKMGAACVLAKHPLAKGISLEDIDGAKLKWPPINPVGAQEFLYLCQGIVQLLTASEGSPVAASGGTGNQTTAEPQADKPPIMTREELRSYLIGAIDVSIDSADRDYLTSVGSDAKVSDEPGQITDDEKKNLNRGNMESFADNAIAAAGREPKQTSFNIMGDD